MLSMNISMLQCRSKARQPASPSSEPDHAQDYETPPGLSWEDAISLLVIAVVCVILLGTSLASN
ncbi:hypothetical protein ACFQAT_00780 [Undibacterium arcticum]|uniref:Uncharacterized protein n=1 Tax=Undibacterium arcticum TaxID=1762892 RepID=A0ABV7EY26_9BURK